MAHLIVVMKNSVYASQALSIIPSTLGDWKSANDPVYDTHLFERLQTLFDNEHRHVELLLFLVA